MSGSTNIARVSAGFLRGRKNSQAALSTFLARPGGGGGALGRRMYFARSVIPSVDVVGKTQNKSCLVLLKSLSLKTPDSSVSQKTDRQRKVCETKASRCECMCACHLSSLGERSHPPLLLISCERVCPAHIVTEGEARTLQGYRSPSDKSPAKPSC